CQWLSGLPSDADGLDESDPLAFGLLNGAKRIGKDTYIVTFDSKRLSRGAPFIAPADALNIISELPIQYVDLNRQQDYIRKDLEDRIHSVLYRSHYIGGPELTALEQKLADYVGVDHCVCMSSGTDSLLVGMMALGISAGDEVITTPFTFAATGQAISFIGAKAVYADIDPVTFNLDPELIEDKITDKTRAIMPVSLYGQCCEMDKINEIASRYHLSVIEDAAQSFGATYKGNRSCGLSTIGCTSFFPAKPLGAYGDAGASFTADPELAKAMRQIIEHGQESRYKHVRLGLNARMDSLQAAALLSKLQVFNDELIKRNSVAKQYTELLIEHVSRELVELPTVQHYNKSSWAQYTIRVSRRDQVRKNLTEAGVPTAVHYPIPLYQQESLAEVTLDCENTETAVQQVLSLPMHPYLNSKTQDYIANSLIRAIDF
ncbi:MAG: DegT/DnrJ/EryC1/StrS family aminotransferase, partial [Chloroflexota bacterium]|nr:DegT/DnrJ/EryC1/StrS family aminotransferase [Chloroflexota bacterium]